MNQNIKSKLLFLSITFTVRNSIFVKWRCEHRAIRRWDNDRFVRADWCGSAQPHDGVHGPECVYFRALEALHETVRFFVKAADARIAMVMR